MDVDNALDFCNQYLMMKILIADYAEQHTLNNRDSNKEQPIKKKKGRTQKFQNPNKKIKDKQPQSNKNQQTIQKQPTKKKKVHKLQQGTKIKHENDEQKSRNQNDDQSGYVPIQSLLSGLMTNPNKQYKHSSGNNYVSFGSNQNKERNNIYQKYNGFNYKKNQPFSGQYQVQNWDSNWNNNNNWKNSDRFNRLDRYDQDWIYRQSKNINPYNTLNQFSLNPSRSQYFYDSPISRIKQQAAVGYHVPASRSSRIRSPLARSKSGSDLSSISATKTTNLSKKKKKNAQRSFFLPSNSSNTQDQNLESSRVINVTSQTISKLQKELNQRSLAKNPHQETNFKSKITQNYYQQKSCKRQTSLIRQLEDYSGIQLDLGVQESISFLSQARGPPKPIQVQMKK